MRALSQRLLAALGSRDQDTLVLMSQVYVPDPAAVGQYMHQVAAAMVERGTRVIVFAADSGYDDPQARYERYERIDGVHVVRLPLSSFGRASLAKRLLGGGIFTSEAALLAASLPRVDSVLISTSPPMVALAGIAVSRLRGARLCYWAMDINPDQIIATGTLAANSLAARSFEWLNRQALAQARTVITLDAFMAERLRSKLEAPPEVHVLPPWPLFDTDAIDPSASHAWRSEHGLSDKRVVMYSGNLSPVHPVETLLEAARKLRDDARLVFVFIGGGRSREDIRRLAYEHQLSNVRLLPYEPLERLPVSLAAADLHLVSMGNAMVGIVHPSKVYSALAVGRPILALGPSRSAIAQLVLQHHLGWHVEHGDVDGAVAALASFARTSALELSNLGERARDVARGRYDKSRLLDEFCRWLSPREDRVVPAG